MALPDWLTKRDTFTCAPQTLIRIPTAQAMVVSSVLFDRKFLARIASKVGSLTLYSLDPQFNGDEKSLESALSNPQDAAATAGSGRISAGSVPAPVIALDREFDFGGLIQVTDWDKRLVANKDPGGDHAVFHRVFLSHRIRWESGAQ